MIHLVYFTFITSAEEEGNNVLGQFVCLFVRYSLLKKFWTDFDEIYGGVGVAQGPSD